MNQQTVLQLAMSAGEVLLRNGAEIFRVQETIERILAAYGVESYELYVVSNGIFVALEGERGSFALRSVPVSAIHLGRIVSVNELSRAIEQDPDPKRIEEYRERMQVCADAPPFPLWLRMLACGLGSGGFCYLLSGGILDCAAAFFCGGVLQLFMSLYGKSGRSRFMHTLLGAALVTSIAFGIAGAFPAFSLDHMIIGAIISLVPGVALTTSIRDFFNGDFVSGNIHLIDAALTGICIAVGVGAALRFWQFVVTGGMSV